MYIRIRLQIHNASRETSLEICYFHNIWLETSLQLNPNIFISYPAKKCFRMSRNLFKDGINE